MEIPPRRPLTLRDVSEASGFSEMTVSRVLRGRGEVSEKTREKVLRTAKAMGYVPNKIAGALASSRVNLVAVIIPSLKNMVFPEVLSGINEVFENTALQPVVGVTDYEPQKEETVLFEMLSWRPSGMIIAGLEHSQNAQMMLHNAGIPIVEVMDTDGDAIDAKVGISHERAGRQMAREIIKAGYQRIGFLGTKMPLDHRARKRFEGFTHELSTHGLQVMDQEYYSGSSSLMEGRILTQTILERSNDLDFLYFSNDMIGAGGLLYLIEKGYDIPSQIGLAGFNGLELLDGLPLQLATMDACRLEIGRRAAEYILASVNGADSELDRKIVLEPKVNLGNTLLRS